MGRNRRVGPRVRSPALHCFPPTHLPVNSLLAMSFRVSAATLIASPFRTFLSTLGIVIGVASLVAVLSLGDGMQQFVRRQVSETTDFQAIGVNPVTTRDIDGASVPVD